MKKSKLILIMVVAVIGFTMMSNTPGQCIRSCAGLADGDYQSCEGCTFYATCSYGILTDRRPCPNGLVWDDNLKRCEYESSTCKDDAIYGGWDNVMQGQGFYLDERSIREPCPIYTSGSGSGSVSGGGYSGSGSGSSSQLNPSGRTDIRCTSGNQNCSSIDC